MKRSEKIWAGIAIAIVLTGGVLFTRSVLQRAGAGETPHREVPQPTVSPTPAPQHERHSDPQTVTQTVADFIAANPKSPEAVDELTLMLMATGCNIKDMNLVLGVKDRELPIGKYSAVAVFGYGELKGEKFTLFLELSC